MHIYIYIYVYREVIKNNIVSETRPPLYCVCIRSHGVCTRRVTKVCLPDFKELYLRLRPIELAVNRKTSPGIML